MARPAAAQFDTGFTDSSLPYLDSRDLADATRHLVEARALYVRVAVLWSDIAPTAPPAADARRPNSAGFDRRRIDAAVRAIRGAGLQPVLAVERAPPWAEGPGKPVNGGVGNWKPSARALGNFAAAMAMRYSGSFSPPGGGPLPRVRYFQAWNEPNLPNNLEPQFETRRGRSVSVAAATYRRMLNEVYDAVKGISRFNRVLTAPPRPSAITGPDQYARLPPSSSATCFACRDVTSLPSAAVLVEARVSTYWQPIRSCSVPHRSMQKP